MTYKILFPLAHSHLFGRFAFLLVVAFLDFCNLSSVNSADQCSKVSAVIFMNQKKPSPSVGIARLYQQQKQKCLLLTLEI